MPRPPTVIFAALLRGPAAAQSEQALALHRVDKHLGRALVPPQNRHQSLSWKLPHDLASERRLLQIGSRLCLAPFALTLSAIESPHGEQTVYWRLRGDETPGFTAALDVIHRDLYQAGFGKGVRNTPHVTLSYWASTALGKPIAIDPVIEWPIDQLQLLRSAGEGDDYHYETLGSWPLAGRPAPAQLRLL